MDGDTIQSSRQLSRSTNGTARPIPSPTGGFEPSDSASDIDDDRTATQRGNMSMSNQVPPSILKAIIESFGIPPDRIDPPPPSERVWIIQCHCPANHWIRYTTFAAPFDLSWMNGDDLAHHRLPRDLTDRIMRAIDSLSFEVEEAIVDGSLASVCPVCGAGAPTWHYCPGLTRHATIEEANSFLRQIGAKEAAQAILAAQHRKRAPR
jgi:hypothetical protein